MNIKKKKYRAEHKSEKSKYDKIHSESKKNRCVYCIKTSNNKIYIGSTNSINKRISKHKEEFIRNTNRLLYKTISETGGWDSIKVYILMKDIPCKELQIKFEQHFINMIPKQLSLNIKNAIKRR